MAASILQAIASVRRVFQGSVTREQTASLSQRERVMIGLAIMMVFPDDYLDDLGDEHLRPRRNDLAMVLYDIMGRGIDKYISRDSWLGACRAYGLYAPNPGRGGTKTYTLTPPPELQALVAELGVTPAVVAFKETADAAAAAEKEEAQRKKDELEARVARLRALFEPLTEGDRCLLIDLIKGREPYPYD